MDSLAVKLLDRGIRIRSITPGTHRITCPECSSSRKKSKDKCLSVTIQEDMSAVWCCHHCNWSGGVTEADRPKKIYRRPPPPEVSEKPDAMFQFFEARGISREVVEEMGIYKTIAFFPQEEKELPCIAFPYSINGDVTAIKYRAHIKNDDGTISKIFTQEKDARPTIYNSDDIQPDVVIFVEGEMDVLALKQAGYKSVVSLPSGAKAVETNDEEKLAFNKRLSAIDHHAIQFSSQNKIIIATDADDAGKGLARMLIARFGKDRCYEIMYPPETKDANEVLIKYGPDALINMIEGAKPCPVEGIFDVIDYETDVIKLYDGETNKSYSTGFDSVDEFFKVGKGQFIVVSGIPNHGKSTWLDQVAVQMSRNLGWKFALFSPEHQPSVHIARLIEQVVGKPFRENLTHQRMSAEDMAQGMLFCHQHMTFIESRDDAPDVDWLIDKIKWITLKKGLDAVIIDPYNELDASRGGRQTETEHVSELIGKLKRLARTHDLVIFMVVHPAKMERDRDGKDRPPTLYDLIGSSHWRNKSDAGIVVHRDFDGDFTRILSLKIRHQPDFGRIGEVRLKYNIQRRRYEPYEERVSTEDDF